MHNTLLINKIDMEDKTGQKADVFFQIGQMDKVRDQLMDLFNGAKADLYGPCLYRYNGITFHVVPDKIPDILADLVKMGIKIYSVYQPYQPR